MPSATCGCHAKWKLMKLYHIKDFPIIQSWTKNGYTRVLSVFFFDCFKSNSPQWENSPFSIFQTKKHVYSFGDGILLESAFVRAVKCAWLQVVCYYHKNGCWFGLKNQLLQALFILNLGAQQRHVPHQHMTNEKRNIIHSVFILLIKMYKM